MSERKLNIEDNNYNYYIKEFSSNSDLENLNIYSQILSNKNYFYITNENHSNHIKISSLSLKKILTNGQLEPNEHILFSFYKDIIPSIIINNTEKQKNNINIKEKSYKTKLRGAKKNKKKEKEKEKDIEEKKDSEDIALDVSSPDQLISKDEKENDMDNIYLKNGNNLEPELDLLNAKTNEGYLKTENQSKKYLVSIYNDKIKITHDNLKCFYLSLFFCGLIYAIYILDVLIDKEKTILCLYHIICLPLSFILIYTGLYGYNKINKKIYDDKICLILTYSSLILPILCFIFSRISYEKNVRKNLVVTTFINLIPACFAGICAYILNELKRKKNKRGLLFERMNIV